MKEFKQFSEADKKLVSEGLKVNLNNGDNYPTALAKAI